MFRHVVLLKWKAPLSPAQAESLDRALRDLSAHSTDIKAISHGPDPGVRKGCADYTLVVDFEDADGWRGYSAHPDHKALGAVLAEIASDVQVAQFATAGIAATSGSAPA
jgi:hypothetical protein